MPFNLKYKKNMQDNTVFNCSTSLSDVIIPLLAIGLPTLISFFSDNVLFLASATGSYPGVFVQFLIPCLLVLRVSLLIFH